MRTMDAILAFPPLILAMAVTVGLGVGLWTAALGIALVSIPWYARLLRSRGAADPLDAVRRGGPRAGRDAAADRAAATSSRTSLPVLLIQMAAAFGYAVLALSGLGFIGLGAQIPTPEWGAMITDGLQYSLTGQWWIARLPRGRRCCSW